MGSRTQGRSKISSLLRTDPPIMEKLDILKIKKGGEQCIHDPIHSDTDLKDETGVVVVDTDSIIYIHFMNFSSHHIHLP